MTATAAGPALTVVVTRLGIDGGMDRVVEAMAAALADRGEDDVQLVCVTTRGRLGKLLSPLVFAGALARCLVLGLSGRADVAHLNLATRGSVLRKALMERVLSLAGVPVVVHLHGANFDDYYAACGPLMQAAIRGLFRRAACVVVLGSHWQDFVTRIAGPEVMTAIVYNAVPRVAAATEREDGNVHLVVLGEVGERKGTDVLLDALSLLRGRGVGGWRCTIAGNGAVERFRARAESLGLSGLVTFPGWLDAGAAKMLAGRADIVVLPSRAENLPMSIVEAMAAGKPVVATPVGAVPEILHDGVEGRLVPVGDAGALADALTVLIGDGEMRRRMGEAAAVRHTADLDSAVFIERLVQVWRRAAGRTG
ncbi:glycosyltransferase family 4 protein [Chelatococcus daeguensis]|uniref:glycosyltransferase family 4 protein n=1 Tax=Chelatococcus daeguensis TaxID=444444 RepID=UPI0007ABDD66|nr:glycosyltransferase family 4 protein [Chelatococcus daeguensis]KZE28520.1 hypothetical protein AVW15_06905 [Chelatococcus daeguensis]MBM3083478.1 glycosyltransferase family 4 protein [Chelatococcus daeguensis]